MTTERVITTEGGVQARITLTDPKDPESLIDKVFDKLFLEREEVKPCPECGMKIPRPHVHTCEVGF